MLYYVTLCEVLGGKGKGIGGPLDVIIDVKQPSGVSY